MTGVIVRIFLRYGAGFLVAKGLLSPEDGQALGIDPDVTQMLEMGFGIAVGSVTEAYYYLAKRWGWAT